MTMKENICKTKALKKTYVTPVAEVIAFTPHNPLLGESRITFDTDGSSSMGDQTELEDFTELPAGQTPLSKGSNWGDLWEEH